KHGPKLLAAYPAELAAALGALPADDLWTRDTLVRLLAEAYRAQGRLDLADDVLRESEQRGLGKVSDASPLRAHSSVGVVERSPQSFRARLRRLGGRALGEATEFQPPGGLLGSEAIRRTIALGVAGAVVVLSVSTPPA